MVFLINALYIYIAIFSLYFFILALRNLFPRRSKFNVNKAYNIPQKQLCIVIYTHNQAKYLKRILSQIKGQDYQANNYQVYVILDNCNDESQEFLGLKPSVNVLNLNEGGLIGKDAALSILIEKLIPNKNIDAYVFIGADKYISADFLTRVNYALTQNDVITGSIVYKNYRLNLKHKIKRAYLKYISNFLFGARSLLGLANSINSDFLIMDKSLVDAIGNIDFKDSESELKYSLLLAKIKHRCYFNPFLKCYSVASKVNLKKTKLISRLKLFKNCFTTTKTLNFAYLEYVYSLLIPNNIFVLLGYLFIILFSSNYYFFVSSKFVLSTFLLLVTGFFLSLVNADLRGKDYIYLIMYPFYTIIKHILELPVISWIIKPFTHNSPSMAQKYSVDVSATFKNKKLPCKLDLIVQNDMSKVVFRYKNKKFTTSSHLRMNDAIKEIVDKLREYNFTLNICQACKYFKQTSDGTQNMIQGTCCYNFGDLDPTHVFNVLLWSSCNAYSTNNLHHSVIEDIANN